MNMRRTPVLLGLVAAVATWLAFASPAAADHHVPHHGHHDPTSVGAGAINDSTSSGSGVAINGSVASGDAVAIDGSTASGCSLAAHDSTASGGDCKPHHHKAEHKAVHDAEVARPVAARHLAFTGAPTTALALIAAALVALGVAMVTTTRRSAA